MLLIILFSSFVCPFISPVFPCLWVESQRHKRHSLSLCTCLQRSLFRVCNKVAQTKFHASSFLAPPCNIRDRRLDPKKQLPLRPPSVLFSVFSLSVFLSVVFPYGSPPPARIPLEQEDRSLEDHTRLFRFLANTTSYSDDALCSFYDASLNTACRALSSEDGPREDFTAFVEWTLVRNGSPLTVSREDDLTRSTPVPEPSPSSPRGTEHQPKPTDDGEAISRRDLRASAKPSD